MPTNPPNILLIFTDQQRADTLGTLNPVMRTPTMDRLCAEGTCFTRAYTPVPVCVPARCAMIFGQYAHRTACVENRSAMLQTQPGDDLVDLERDRGPMALAKHRGRKGLPKFVALVP